MNKIDPKELLARIREEAKTTPLVRFATWVKGETNPNKSAPGSVADRVRSYVQEWCKEDGHQAPRDITPADLEKEIVGVAEIAHGLSWAHTEDDAEAWELERRMVLEGAKAGHKGMKNLLPHFLAGDAFNAFSWHGKWRHYGLQSIEVDDKYAGLLSATKIARSELDYVRLPWPCFVVRAPKFLQRFIINGEPLKLIVVSLAKFKGPGGNWHEQYRLMFVTANKFRILPADDMESWCNPGNRHSYNELTLEDVPFEEHDRRQIEVIGRMVLGIIISMNDEKAHRSYAPIGKKPTLGTPRYGTHSSVTLHKIGKPVKIDVRETVYAYATGDKRHLTNVRTLVAGHWKNQPHGPKHSLRRWQHIECYWRGDEGAPLIVRPHVLTGQHG